MICSFFPKGGDMNQLLPWENYIYIYLCHVGTHQPQPKKHRRRIHPIQQWYRGWCVISIFLENWVISKHRSPRLAPVGINRSSHRGPGWVGCFCCWNQMPTWFLSSCGKSIQGCAKSCSLLMISKNIAIFLRDRSRYFVRPPWKKSACKKVSPRKKTHGRTWLFNVKFPFGEGGWKTE